MAMRETVKSLRAYFLVVGVLAVLSALSGAKDAGGNVFVLAMAGANALIGAGFVYFGATLPRQLASDIRAIRLFLLASAAFGFGLNAIVVGLIVSAASVEAVPFQTWAALVLVPAITLYLLANVKRLAAEQAAAR